MKIKKQLFGVLSDGTDVSLFTVSNGSVSFSATDYGATLTCVKLVEGNRETDVTLGYSTLDGYVADTFFFGATIARFAGRIGGAGFRLGGAAYSLDKNKGGNFLHGGFMPSSKLMWSAGRVESKNSSGIKFSRLFADGEQGFPGNLKVTVTYLLDRENRVTCRYDAVTDAATPVNITNHSYFNLAGKGSVLGHRLRLNSAAFLELDGELIPTGKISGVAGTPFDFTEEKEIGRDISKTRGGYDICYATEMYGGRGCGVPCSARKLARVAELSDPDSGRVMTVDANTEGVQVYTANYIEGVVGKNGAAYHAHGAVCLETQCFPDSPNKSQFPSCILLPGKKYRAVTVFGFSSPRLR